MKASSVAEALSAIPGRRDALDQEDDQLRSVIRFVERVLFELEPGVVTHLNYETPETEDAPSAHWIGFEKVGKGWGITWTDQEDDDNVSFLLQKPRHVRAEVFTPMASLDGLAPIEQLIIEVAENLVKAHEARSPMLEVADRLVKTLTAAGFKPI